MKWCRVGVLVFCVMLLPAVVGAADMAMPGMTGSGGAPPPPIHTTMDALHAHGGTPPGWTFLLPRGDAAEGRKLFSSLECYACHAVQGEQFPEPATRERGTGPELTGMGAHHPAEYFAESIVNPNRVIVDGNGYVGPDGLSKMPSYADALTVKQLVDLVAYLGSLRGGEAAHHQHGAHGTMDMPMHHH